MDIATFLVDVMLSLWILAVIVAVARAWRARAPRLADLTTEQVNRFSLWWRRIASRFVQSPREAVWEADALVLSLLRERGHPVEPSRLPANIHKARRLLSRDSSEGTEALRKAMLQYEQVFERLIGGRRREQAQTHGREMA